MSPALVLSPTPSTRPPVGQRSGLNVTLRPELEAHEPAEARASRADVRLLVSRTASGEVSHHEFAELPELLLPGDLLVVNNSATVPAAVVVTAAPAALGADGALTVHFATSMPDGDWLVELRSGHGPATTPFAGGTAGLLIGLPGGAELTLDRRFSRRLWHARLSTAVLPYLLRHGQPIRYSYVSRAWPLQAYQTVFATWPGSAEMPSAARPFTPEIVTRLVSRGVAIAPVTLHTGVSSLEGGEDPYPESYDVPATTARLVNLTRQAGGRVIAAGTTVVRALESAVLARGDDSTAIAPAAGGPVGPAAGWTWHVVTRQSGVAVVDGLLTGLHEPRSTHLWMLAAFAGDSLLRRCYQEAAARGYHWHEFGDVHLLLP
ncbi:MAG TPA: S-adenosylmethionine:tRNA ribosyltransferase-isomerase [Streptosporangiaceae bacterium]|nr:S-adenosylmethionine:tRNA ribosyltransferase-isomerase [Streptosporangiaceae bacterium]